MGQKKLHLQGLRGLAIIAVVLFHFFPKWCPNGYLGVDQFFLLSGFLMTMMLHRHITLNFTKIFDFLYRRVKRIVPLYYLATAVTLVCINLMPKSAFNTNYSSAIRALLFVTNIIRPDGEEGYAEKLGLAVDMFTHTWSLALEMQFYLLFPLIHIAAGYFHGNGKNYLLLVLGLFSLAFHLFSDSFLSFNSVFSRIWQFLAGMFVFINLKENKPTKVEDFEKQKLIENDENEEKDEQKLSQIITTVSIFPLALVIFSSQVVDPFIGRVNTIVLSGLLVYLGEGCALLENEALVFLGEISYCWYLVHWPIIALCKINGFLSELELFYALIASFFLSLVVHYGFERFYLKWDKKTTFQVLFIFLIANGAALYQVHEQLPSITPEISAPVNNTSSISQPVVEDTPFIFASDHLGDMKMGYENMTNEARVHLNQQYDAQDMSRLKAFPCTKRFKTNISDEIRCQVGEGKNITGTPLTLLVIGNSWALNVMGTIHSECRDAFSSIHLSGVGACEPFYRTTVFDSTSMDCGIDTLFQTAVEEYKPDVLIIASRHLNGMVIINGTNPFDDNNFALAAERFTALEKLVKKKIYILDAFPRVSDKITRILNEFLLKGTPFKDTDFLDLGPAYLMAKQRMYRLVRNCSKCELFDYATQFYINGQFKIYDPKYHVAFISKGRHLTPPGLERVRPLIRHICHSL